MAIGPIPNLATFPVYLDIGRFRLHPHTFFETLSYIIGFRIYLWLRHRFGDPIVTPLRWAVIASAVAGAAIGSKILYWLEDPELTLKNLHNPAFLIGGKTIIGALVGGLICVELVKHLIGLRTPTGDLYAIPLALGIAIGRIGCFLTGLSDNTYGTPTNLPWGIDFGDTIPRHPTQLYEIAFLLALLPFLYIVLRRITVPSGAVRKRSDVPSESMKSSHVDSINCPPESSLSATDNSGLGFRPGDTFKLFMVSYAASRLLDDFIKPYPRLLLGLGGIQWACVAILLYYSPDILRWIFPTRHPNLAPA